jgi:hypothetical protein
MGCESGERSLNPVSAEIARKEIANLSAGETFGATTKGTKDSVCVGISQPVAKDELCRRLAVAPNRYRGAKVIELNLPGPV